MKFIREWLGHFFFILAVTFSLLQVFTNDSHAGKIDEVKKAVKDKCSKDMSESDLVDAVVKAYDCVPGAEITVAGCAIKCLKSGGSVVGGAK